MADEYLIHIPVVILAIYLARKIYTVFFGPLSHVPGSFWAKFTRLWELFALRPGNFEQKLIDLHNRYGPIVRVGPTRCSVDSPEAVKTIYGLGQGFPKSDYYDAFSDMGRKNIFAERDPKVHSGMRRRIGQLYSLGNLLSYEGFVDKCSAKLEEELQKISKKGQPVEMGQLMQFYAFDVIGSITTGSPFGLLEKGYDDGIVADIHDVVYYGTFTGIFPKLHWWIQKTLHLLKPFGLLSSRQALVHFMLFHAEQRRKGITSNDKNDFLTKLLKLEEDGQNTRADTFNALGNNIIAGSDTTSITLSAVIYYLIKNPSKMARLRREIDQKAAEGALSDPITFQQSQNMPYLQAVIKETLRIHPAVAFILARRVPPGGATVCGKFLPQDTDVGINPWVAHQNAQVFPEPTQFIPERWLGPKESVAMMEAYFSAFGFGSRVCIGRHISMLEIGKLIPRLVSKYEFEISPPDSEWDVKTYMFAKQKFHCKVQLRGA